MPKKTMFIKAVVKAKEVPINLSIKDQQAVPNRWLKIHQFEEKLFQVEYDLVNDGDLEVFKAMIKKNLKNSFSRVIKIEYLNELQPIEKGGSNG